MPLLILQPRLYAFARSFANMAQLFTGTSHAETYRKYRPTYCSDVYDSIITYCRRESNAFKRALDLGCGSGQSTFPLVPYFQQVIGIDPSALQLEQARTTLNGSTDTADTAQRSDGSVTFAVGTAEDLSAYDNSSVDLITCAQAFHWMDTDKFYPEAKRVLRAHGVLAAYGYGNVKLDNPKANDVMLEFHTRTVGPYWDERRHHVDSHLEEFKLPFRAYSRDDSLRIVRRMPITAFIGYISSWSSYQTYIKRHPGADILAHLHKRICEAYDTKTPDELEVNATWPVFILLGRN